MTTVTRQIHFAVKGNRKRMHTGPAPEPVEPTGRTPRVAILMALAIRFDRLLQDGVVTNQSELAQLAHVTQPRMTQIMNLLHLAPDIQEEILHLPTVHVGRDQITEREMRPIAAEPSWSQQRMAWRKLQSARRLAIASPTEVAPSIVVVRHQSFPTRRAANQPSEVRP